MKDDIKYEVSVQVAQNTMTPENPNDRIEIGNYPIVNVYANLHLKHTRIYAMMYHVSEGMGNSMSFLAPHYPLNTMWFKFGLSWNFFN